MIDWLLSGRRIPELGIWGDLRRRFSKTQILQAIDHSVPSDRDNPLDPVRPGWTGYASP